MCKAVSLLYKYLSIDNTDNSVVQIGLSLALARGQSGLTIVQSILSTSYRLNVMLLYWQSSAVTLTIT